MTENITSDQLNCLIFRYLTESGFEHSANVFEEQAGNAVHENLIPAGALVETVRKGLQYCRLLVKLDESGTDDDDFSLLQPFDFITKDRSELKRFINEKKEKFQKERKKKGKGKAKKFDQEQEQEIEEPSERNREGIEKNQKRKKKKKKKKQHSENIDTQLSKDFEDKVDVKHEDSGD